MDDVPRHTAELVRSHITEIATEMALAIQSGVPEYARPHDETYTRTVRRGVEQALTRFADLLDQRNNRDETWREVYCAIGAGEVREGRSLDALHAAIRVGARVGLRRLVSLPEIRSLPVGAIIPVAEAIFRYLDDLASASADGYTHARAVEAGEPDRRRRRLLELLITEPPPAAEAIAAAASAARWSPPRRLVAVAVETPIEATLTPVLSPEILTGLHRTQPCLLLPEPPGPAQLRALVNGVARYRTAVGPPVPPADAAKSLRWARLALDLARRNVITDAGMLWCTDHLATLAVFQDDDLLTALTERHLTALADLRSGQRELLTDTLRVWLQLNMNANEVATRLHVHPQTVRHRLRQLVRLFGGQIRDPDQRFELEIALRAEYIRRRAKPALAADRVSPRRPPPRARRAGPA